MRPPEETSQVPGVHTCWGRTPRGGVGVRMRTVRAGLHRSICSCMCTMWASAWAWSLGVHPEAAPEAAGRDPRAGAAELLTAHGGMLAGQDWSPPGLRPTPSLLG